MRFGILGPLWVSVGSDEVVIARRERVLLAVLLLHANRTVSVERVVDAIWGERPPGDSTGQVHSSVYRLRKALAAAGAPREMIVTDPAGYRVRVDPQSLDLAQFRGLRDQARAATASGQLDEARGFYRAALDLWRGRGLDGVDSDVIRYAAAGLDEEHLQVAEECIEVELSLGRGREVVAELTELVGQHPHREGLHRALMLALYRGGRQADALAAFRSARALLQEELGLEPGPELQRLHQAILSRDPELDLSPEPPGEASADPGQSTVPRPRELPADVAGFTGRNDALKALDGLLAGPVDGSPVPVVISAIAGTAGIGKTALAVHWAHQVVDRFPDGQLYVNLRGYDPDQPVAPADALARFLGALGVASQDIPLEPADRAARYRSEVAERRMLIVLDNAATVEQIRPLLPGTGSCTAVVTSRDSLAGLVAVDGARRIDLDLLPPGDAVALLRRLAGDRVDAEPDAALTLVHLCARLPLALRVAAELAASRPNVPLADLVVELSDRQRRLELLDAGGDPHAAVRVVFSWSIRRLSPETARMFRLLGLHPGSDFDAYAATALADTSLELASQVLEQLTRAHLIHPTASNRYAMHDLLRAYAAQLASDEDSDAERQAALTRLFDYYLATAATAMDMLNPAEIHRRPRIRLPATPTPALSGAGDALVWLDTERHVLVASSAYASNYGWPARAIELSNTLNRYLDGGHFNDALAIHRHAYHAAQKTGDQIGLAHALRHTGTILGRMGQYGTASDHIQQALSLFRRASDQAGETLALTSIGTIERRLGRYESALEYQQLALALFREADDRTGEAQALASIGIVEERLGRYTSAVAHNKQALGLFRELDNTYGEATVLNNLGTVEERLGHYKSATRHHEQALRLLRRLGNLMGQARALENLGVVYVRLGQPQSGTLHFEQALALYRVTGDKDGEAWALNGLGEATQAADHGTYAATHFAKALSIATHTEARDQQARAHAGLGQAHHSIGEHSRSRAHFEQALAIYAELGMPEADEVREQLAQLGDETGG